MKIAINITLHSNGIVMEHEDHSKIYADYKAATDLLNDLLKILRNEGNVNHAYEYVSIKDSRDIR